MFKIPILLLSYNRYSCTKKSLNAILKIKPQKLYISSDGPKLSDIDNKKVLKVRKLFSNIKLKNIKMNFNDKNLGCKSSNIKAINWFFNQEKEGIIIEDDCIASKDFFYFAEIMLKKYRNKKKIYCISGSNFQDRPIDSNSYYFSKYNHCWGWATWRDRWDFNDKRINFWPKFKKSDVWNKLHRNKMEKKYWNKIFDQVFKEKFDSWAYPWTLSVWKQNGITITPNFNLVKNIGFGNKSTHSFFLKDKIKYLNKKKIKTKVIHPTKIIINDKADFYVFKNHFKGYNYIWPYRGLDLIKKLLLNPFVFFKKIIN